VSRKPAERPLARALRGGLLRFALAAMLLLTGGFACGTETPESTLKIGLAEEPRTLNIWLASDANSQKVLAQIYQPLYRPEPTTLKLVPWLAASQPVFDPATVSYTVTLRPAKWSDGSAVTSADVAFTARLIKEFKIPRFAAKWSFVTRIETPDQRTVRYYLKAPTAVFLTRTLTGPIVQQKKWADVVRSAREREKPLAALLNHKVDKPVSSGPFQLAQWRQGAFLHLTRNPHFFGQGLTIGGLRLGPHLDHLIFKIYGTSDVAILAIKKGALRRLNPMK